MTDDSADHGTEPAGEHILSDLWTAGGHLLGAAGEAVDSVAHAGAAGFELLTGDTDAASQDWHKAGDDLSNAGTFVDWAGTEAHHAWDVAADEASSASHELGH
jgi:hypothetical protein